jgi:hypothetical protein
MPSRDIEKIRASRRKWYRNNKAKASAAIIKRKQEMRKWFRDFKSTLSCKQCGEDHIACLDFHHVNPGKKNVEIADAMQRGLGKDRILAEIAICVVLCRNCHAKEHYALKEIAGQTY